MDKLQDFEKISFKLKFKKYKDEAELVEQFYFTLKLFNSIAKMYKRVFPASKFGSFILDLKNFKVGSVTIDVDIKPNDKSKNNSPQKIALGFSIISLSLSPKITIGPTININLSKSQKHSIQKMQDKVKQIEQYCVIDVHFDPEKFFQGE